MSDEQRPAPVAPVVVDYSTPKPRNRNASRAMIFGLLGFLPFVPGIIAIVSARRGLRDLEADPRVGGKAAAKAGLWLGIASIVAWVALSIAAVPATIQARRQALRVACMSQLRQVGLATQIYATSNNGLLPPTFDALVKSGTIPALMLQCPACAGDPTKPVATSGALGSYNYVYLGAGRKLQSIKSVSSEPIAYEPLTNHDDPGINVLFADSHVEMLPGPGAQAFLQKYAPTTLPTSGSAVER